MFQEFQIVNVTNETTFVSISTIIKDYDVIVVKDKTNIYIFVCLGVSLSAKPFRAKTQLRELPLVLDQQD